MSAGPAGPYGCRQEVADVIGPGPSGQRLRGASLLEEPEECEADGFVHALLEQVPVRKETQRQETYAYEGMYMHWRAVVCSISYRCTFIFGTLRYSCYHQWHLADMAFH